ncbi:MAG: tetratricopeptide repeat protein [Prevotellaceae bacterium]|nr:tetratricopeptide repeat protein [Prevotellaceae bacterium]
MKKYFFSLLTLLTGGVAANAQNVAVDYFRTGQYDLAKPAFEAQLSSSKAESSYYLGEIAYAGGDFEQARTLYQQGLAADPTYALNSVGLERFTLKSDVEAGIKSLTDISKANKKNAEVLIAIAKAYYDQLPAVTDPKLEKKVSAAAEKMVNTAEKSDKTSPLAFMMRGDLSEAKGDVGGAAGHYEQAILLNDAYLVPYIKIAQIYVDINPNESLSRLNEVQDKNPDYLLSKRYMARAFYNLGFYERAIAIYEAYIDQSTSPVGDITDYAASLFFAERYDQAKEMTLLGLQKDQQSFVLNRLQMYSAAIIQQKNIAQRWGRDSASLVLRSKTLEDDKAHATASIEKFFGLPLGKNKYIPRDLATYGNILCLSQQVEQAVEQYNKAIRMSNEAERASEKLKAGEYKLMSENLSRAKYPALAAEYNNLYIEEVGADGGAITLADYFTTARYLYLAGNPAYNMALQDPSLDSVTIAAKVNLYLLQSDSIFGMVVDSSGTAEKKYQPMLFRARVNSLRDPDATVGLAKPYYEAALAINLENDLAAPTTPKIYLTERLEMYRYLSYYHLVQYDDGKGAEQNREEAIAYSEKMLELDPTNATALQIKNALLPPAPTAARRSR